MLYLRFKHPNLKIKIRKFYLFKGCLEPSHFIFDINVGKRRIRHKTTLNLDDFNRFLVDLEIHHSISESFYAGYASFRH